MKTTLETLAREAWIAWGGYAQWTFCAHCDERRYCHSHDGEKYTCLDCFDQGRR